MNDEIKEILESSRKIIKSNRENGFDRIIMLGDDIDKLLDYITNLQQENERLKQPKIFIDTQDMEERYVVTAKEYDVLNDIIDYLKSKGE